MNEHKNPLGYSPGDETYIFRRSGGPLKVTVSKVTPTGITSVATTNYSGQTIHRRFMPNGRELGSSKSWYADRIESKAGMAKRLADVQREIAKRELRDQWKRDCQALATICPWDSRDECIAKVQAMLLDLKRVSP